MSETNKKVVLITGSSNGLGNITAKKLAMEGYTVYASMRNVNTNNSTAKSELEKFAKNDNLGLQVIELDVTDEASVEKAVEKIIQKSGQIDVVVNNAGIVSYGAVEAHNIKQVQDFFDVNVFGALRVNRAVIPHMRKQKEGLIIYISSGLGRVVFPSMGLYCASKFASEAFAETARYEMAEFNIDSVILEPGVYPTNLNNIAGKASDETRQNEYKLVSQLSEALPTQFGEGFKDEAHSPELIAKGVVKLIETKQGERPVRTVIGIESEPVIPLNELSAKIQAGVLTGFGTPELAKYSI